MQHSGNGSSHIDYILTNKPAFLGPTTIAKYAASNTSAHFSIHSTCKMHIQAKKSKIKWEIQSKQSSKALWQQADTNRYNKIIFDQLQNSDIQGTGTSNSKFLKITETVLKAEKGAVPTKIIRPHGPRFRLSATTLSLNKRPKGPHIVHLSTMCHIFGGLARAAILFFGSARKTQTW